MASRRRPFFTYFVVILMGMTVLNAWQVRTLRAEVTALKAQVEDLQTVGDRRPVHAVGNTDLVAEARRHADMARKYVADGEWKKARVELDKSLDYMRSFSRTSEESSKDTVDQLRDTWRDAGSSIEKMWRGVTEKSGGAKSKGG